MLDFQKEKALVLDFYSKLDSSHGDEITKVLDQYTSKDYHFRGMHPFYEQYGAHSVSDVFWKPFRRAFTHMQRRQDIFMAGNNVVDDNASRWVCSMGHLMGLFDKEWLGILPTKKMAFLRYAEFHQIVDNKIVQTALFCDIISVMRQSGFDPLPMQTGAFFITPGPRTHDGLLYEKQEESESQKTISLIHSMINDINQHEQYKTPKEELNNAWHEDMIWYGPAGIGATYTQDRYILQHQQPFRQGIYNRQFNGHICRMSEGRYGGFFGWANLSMNQAGGFLGLPATDKKVEMRVVDIYRREGDKISENWVFIDLLHYLSMMDMNILEKYNQIQYKDIG